MAIDCCPECGQSTKKICSTCHQEILICDTCGSPMVLRTGKYGQFWGCSTYPKCKTTAKHFTNGHSHITTFDENNEYDPIVDEFDKDDN